MTFRNLLSPRRWIVGILCATGAVTAVSFVRAANTVTFGPGAGLQVRGTPMNQRPIGNSFTLPGGQVFGGYPRPVQIMPTTPILPRGFGQNPTGQFNSLLGNAQIQGGALGQQGGIAGGIQGISGGISGGIQGGISGGIAGGIAGGIGGISGGISGGIGGIAGGISGGISGGIGGMAAQGQNFQNPTGNFGFPQAPVGYIGGFGGGGITGAGIAGNSGQLGVGISGQQQGISGGIGGIAGGIGGGIGGFGGGGIGGKGVGFAGGTGN